MLRNFQKYFHSLSLRHFLLATSMLFLATFILSSLIRIFFPYQLSWMEGAIVDHARRILSGQSLYGPLSIDFTPFTYPPLYYYICALFMKIFGVGFVVPRMISFISTLLLLYFFWRLILFETKSKFYGFLGVGFFSAFYSFTRCFFDMARVDALHIFLLFLGVYLLRVPPKKGKILSVYASAFVFYLSLFTKQQALLVIVFIALYLLFENFSKFLKFVVTFSLFSLLTFAFFQNESGGWFLFYIYRLPAAVGVSKKYFFQIFQDLLVKAPVFLSMLPYLFLKRKDTGNMDSSTKFFYMAFFSGSFITSWLSRAQKGGVENTILPILLSASFLGVIAFWKFEKNCTKNKYLRHGSLYFLIFMQFFLLVYNPMKLWPQKYHYIVNKKFVDFIGSFKGEVLVNSMGYIPHLAGKKTFAHKSAVIYFFKAKKNKLANMKAKLNKLYKKEIQKKRFGAIICRKDFYIVNNLKRYYRFLMHFVLPHSIYVNGVMTSDWNVYVPIK